jgi:hypothetical protein
MRAVAEHISCAVPHAGVEVWHTDELLPLNLCRLAAPCRQRRPSVSALPPSTRCRGGPHACCPGQAACSLSVLSACSGPGLQAATCSRVGQHRPVAHASPYRKCLDVHASRSTSSRMRGMASLLMLTSCVLAAEGALGWLLARGAGGAAGLQGR